MEISTKANGAKELKTAEENYSKLQQVQYMMDSGKIIKKMDQVFLDSPQNSTMMVLSSNP